MMDHRIFYCFPFFLAAALIFNTGIITFRKIKARGGGYLACVCMAAAAWAISEGILYLGLDLETNMLVTKLQYPAIALVPPTALLFILSIFGFESYANNMTRWVLFIIAGIIVLIVWTNPQHKLYFTEYYAIETGPFPMIGLKHGPLWWISTLYIYFLVAAMSIILIRQVLTCSGYHRSQAAVILFAVAFVWIVNAIYVSGNSPIPNMDMSPIAFVLVAGAMSWGFFRYGLLDILPVARAEIFKGLDDIILVVDENNRILDINPAAESAFQVEAPLIKGQNASEAFSKYPQVQQILYGLTSSEIGLAQDGQDRVYDLRISFLSNAKNSKIGKVIALRDITDRKKAEEDKKELENRLLRAEKMEAIGTLAGGVAHDLNNVLSGLVSYPELLLMDIPEDSPLRAPIVSIKKSGERASTIVQDLLTLARRGVSVCEVVCLNDIIFEYLNSPQFQKLKSYHPHVEIESDLDTTLLNIAGSPIHLSKTIMNLVANAAEAMPDGGKIRIETRNKYIDLPIEGYDVVKEGDYVVLTVSDNGIGMTPEETNKIFEPFYTKKVMGRSGTGLGMAVVWGSVKDHKGYIHVKSDAGKGSTIKLYFPVTRKSAMEADVPVSIENYKGEGQSVLVVDDVEEQREIATKILTQLGYSVDTVSSGEKACEYFESKPADLMVLDMIMEPGIDGLETYKRIISRYPQQRAIIASGFSETERVKEVQRLGAGSYVKKPYTIEKIGMAVKTELSL